MHAREGRINDTPDATNAQTLWLAARIERKLGRDQAVRSLGARLRRDFAQSAEAALFDMELDALLILVLSLGVLVTGKAGGWVLAVAALWSRPTRRRAKRHDSEPASSPEHASGRSA